MSGPGASFDMTKDLAVPLPRASYDRVKRPPVLVF